MDGKRFYYARDLNSFIVGGEPAPDGEGGVVSEQEEEYMAWTISPSRTVLFMDSYAESLSESVAGHFLDTETLHAVSSLQGCRLTMKKLG